MPHTLKQALELKIPPGVLVPIMALSMWFVSTALPMLTFHIPFQPIVASLLLLFGFTTAGLGVLEFRRATTTVNPLKPLSSAALVTRGVYQRTRNPMYLGFLFTLFGVAIATANLAAFVFLPLFVIYMNEFQIKPEERALTAKFGDDFAQYRFRVKMWM